MKRIDVSVLVLTYNPQFLKLLKTLQSVINQIGVTFELIVSDDGSEINHFDEIRCYLKNNNFSNYVLIENLQNKGTVQNFKRALDRASGQYVKCISPGDYLYDNYVLRDWMKFNNKNKVLVSFGRCIYYSDKKVISSGRFMQPYNKSVYSPHHYDEEAIKIQTILLGDYICGASFLVERQLAIQYSKLIPDKILYCEDSIFRFMLFDHIKEYYFSRPVVYYEYGNGISTTKNKKWSNVIQSELKTQNNYICSKYEGDKFVKKYVKLKNWVFLGDSRVLKQILITILFPKTLLLTIQDCVYLILNKLFK